MLHHARVREKAMAPGRDVLAEAPAEAAEETANNTYEVIPIMRSEQEVNRAMEQYADTVQRLCMIHLKNYHDTEDIFQTVF